MDDIRSGLGFERSGPADVAGEGAQVDGKKVGQLSTIMSKRGSGSGESLSLGLANLQASENQENLAVHSPEGLITSLRFHNASKENNQPPEESVPEN